MKRDLFRIPFAKERRGLWKMGFVTVIVLPRLLSHLARFSSFWSDKNLCNWSVVTLMISFCYKDKNLEGRYVVMTLFCASLMSKRKGFWFLDFGKKLVFWSYVIWILLNCSCRVNYIQMSKFCKILGNFFENSKD